MSYTPEHIRYGTPQELPALIADLQECYMASSLILVCDQQTRKVCYDRYGFAKSIPTHALIELPEGEGAKQIEVILTFWKKLLSLRIDRKAMLCALGGGAITDVCGFVASTFKRGITLFNIPTTLLAMVDAAIGGKTAINFEGTKNMIGSFYTANATIIVPDFLQTLTSSERLSGYGEVVKYAWLIGQGAWLDVLHSTPGTISTDLIIKCITYKQEIVAQDPYDKGIRKVLNLGHTTGHAFEAYYKSKGERLHHGFGVAHGIFFALYLSYKRDWIASEQLQQYGCWLKDNYPPLHFTCDDYPKLIEQMHQDKKNVSKKTITMVLLKSPGQPVVVDDVNAVQITEAFDCYKDFFGV